jgi:hypothetical protein
VDAAVRLRDGGEQVRRVGCVERGRLWSNQIKSNQIKSNQMHFLVHESDPQDVTASAACVQVCEL